MTQSLCTNGPSSSLCSFLGRAQKQKIENQSGQPLFAAAIPSVSRILGHEAPPCARSTRGLGDGESGGASEVGARGPEAKTAGPRSTLCVPRVWMPVAGSPLILRGREGVRTVRGPQAGFSRRCVGVPALSSSPPVRRLQRLVCVPSVRFTCKVTHMLKQSCPFTSVCQAELSKGLPTSYLPWSGTREQLGLSSQVYRPGLWRARGPACGLAQCRL